MALVAVAWFPQDGGLDELEHSTRLMNQLLGRDNVLLQSVVSSLDRVHLYLIGETK
jgi:hypothetical protein